MMPQWFVLPFWSLVSCGRVEHLSFLLGRKTDSSADLSAAVTNTLWLYDSVSGRNTTVDYYMV